MAYGITGFATPGPTKDAYLMSYVSTDAAATVEGAGYFNDAASILPAIGIIFHLDSNAGVANMYAYTNDGSTVTLMTGAVAVTGPGVEFT